MEEKRLTIRNVRDGRIMTRNVTAALNLAKYPEWEIIGSEAEQYAAKVIEPPKKVVEPAEEVKAVEPDQITPPEPQEEGDVSRDALNAKYKALFGRFPSSKWGDEAVIKRIKDKENE